MQVISASRSEWIAPFTGLEPGQFRKLVRVVAKRGGDEIADGRPGRQWRLDLADRVLLVANYWRTNLTMRQLGPLFGVSHSAAHRVIDTIGPLLALALVRKRRIDAIAIVRDLGAGPGSPAGRAVEELPVLGDVQVAIDADTRLVIATGDAHPGNRNDCTVYRDSGIQQESAGHPVMADDGYQGNAEVIMPLPQTSGRERSAGLEARPQRRPPHDPRPHRAHPGQDDVLENPARLSPRRQHTQRHSVRNRPPTQHPHPPRRLTHKHPPPNHKISYKTPLSST
ncbi:hypothetical protein SacxiDRAFT_0552 [Saccharomonospora xinjiangensis XJ-54]|uniref:Transposase Helix-turn-helix domain-containing protein n=1 Tax=Saccharomonospora xinjiangensis XJ-54 TaxID=882086 RepID=I0UY74_9PSEU|nr:hypothetical protein SacxiDRAFT_0552 [Saccharomonospora xinjiangensis XJ-54]